jgi:peptide/nickel transport system permease protein
MASTISTSAAAGPVPSPRSGGGTGGSGGTGGAVADRGASTPSQTAPPLAARRRRRRSSWTLRLSAAAAGLFVLLGIIGPWIAGDTTTGVLKDRLEGIGQGGHLLGTDGQGRDVLARLVAGARPSMLAGITPVLVAGVIGTALGVGAGLSGRLVHAIVMRTLDVLYAFPAVLLAIAVAAALGRGTMNAIISLSIVLIAPIARMAETETMRLRDMDFMESARVSGASRLSIARRQVLPNVLPTLVVYCTAAIGLCLVYAGGLSFLGLGVTPPAPEWGSMLNEHRQFIFNDPTLALIPALVIFLASIAFNVLGDGLRDRLDVRREVGR